MFFSCPFILHAVPAFLAPEENWFYFPLEESGETSPFLGSRNIVVLKVFREGRSPEDAFGNISRPKLLSL